jgi:hypothetical protein
MDVGRHLDALDGWHVSGTDHLRYCLRAIGRVDRLRESCVGENFSSETIEDRQLCISVVGEAQVQGSMPVPISERVQNVQGVYVSRLLPSTVRLQPRDRRACSGTALPSYSAITSCRCRPSA